jgi:hypothetical protein
MRGSVAGKLGVSLRLTEPKVLRHWLSPPASLQSMTSCLLKGLEIIASIAEHHPFSVLTASGNSLWGNPQYI